jgi:hypothetical protein
LTTLQLAVVPVALEPPAGASGIAAAARARAASRARFEHHRTPEP